MKRFLQKMARTLLGAGLLPLAALAQGPTPDPSFVPTELRLVGFNRVPVLWDMVRQPDGKLVLAGSFVTIAAPFALNLCRLLPDGSRDTTFAATTSAGTVYCVALQPDGKLLIGGSFTTVNRQPCNGLARLLPDGSLDAAFVPPFVSSAGGATPLPSVVRRLVLQPGLGIVALGTLYLPAGAGATAPATLVRLGTATGALDPTFQYAFTATPAVPASDLNAMLALPNGRLVLGGYARPVGGRRCNVWGILPNGALDPAFAPLPDTTVAFALARDPATGNIYAASVMGQGEPVRLLPNGTRDPTFNAAGAFGPGGGQIWAMAVQPNGRLLLGGSPRLGNPNRAGTWRLLPNGTRDPSYLPANGPDGTVFRVLVQPDGALLFCGSFQWRLNTSFAQTIVRMLDPNVLLGSIETLDKDDLQAWPVPAREVLHLRLPAARRARQAQLLDALGRVVRRQALADGQPASALPTAGLAPGSYLLRVAFAEGAPAYRRVAVE